MTEATDATGLGCYLRGRRERLGWTLTALAARADLSKSGLSALETGKVKLPGADKRRRLAAALGIRHVDLLVAAGELTPAEAGEGTTPTAANPAVEALCAALRRVADNLDARDIELVHRVIAIYDTPRTPKE